MFRKQFIPKKGLNIREEYYFKKFQEKINSKKCTKDNGYLMKLVYLINCWL